MDKTKILFVDVNTQKCFVEHFGAKAVPDCPDIRENLMELTYMGPANDVLIASLVYTGEGCEKDSNDFMKVNDSVASSGQILFEHFRLEEFDCEELGLFLDERDIQTVFVYGVPLEGTVTQVCEWLKDKVKKIWLVHDCIKSYDGQEQKYLDMLKLHGIKMIDTRNLESLINF